MTIYSGKNGLLIMCLNTRWGGKMDLYCSCTRHHLLCARVPFSCLPPPSLLLFEIIGTWRLREKKGEKLSLTAGTESSSAEDVNTTAAAVLACWPNQDGSHPSAVCSVALDFLRLWTGLFWPTCSGSCPICNRFPVDFTQFFGIKLNWNEYS